MTDPNEAWNERIKDLEQACEHYREAIKAKDREIERLRAKMRRIGDTLHSHAAKGAGLTWKK
jgi:predicted  nucleic acid-binding Zn-ribbon protein